MFNTEFLHPDQNFKLLFGTEGCFRASASLAPSVDKNSLTDGIWLALQDEGTWVVADKVPNAYPVWEMKYQYDNQAVEAVTVIMGGGWYAITKKFNYPSGAPAIGDLLMPVNGVLQPVAGDGSEDALAVVRVEQVVGADRLLVKRLS